jgi:hypothetical protein
VISPKTGIGSARTRDCKTNTDTVKAVNSNPIAAHTTQPIGNPPSSVHTRPPISPHVASTDRVSFGIHRSCRRRAGPRAEPPISHSSYSSWATTFNKPNIP